MSFNNTGKEFEVGKTYQFQGDRLTDFGQKTIQTVELLEDNSTETRYKLKFKDLQDGEVFETEMLKGNFYFSGMPRVWPDGEYSI